MLLLARSFGLGPVSRASMGHGFGHSRVLTAAVSVFFALPFDSPPAFRTTLGHGYNRMFIAAVRSPDRLQFLYLGR